MKATSPGARTQELQVITTLRDRHVHNAAQIARWYQQRRQVELHFDDIKTSLRMHALRCKTPHMIVRELLMHMIAHNHVRHLMVSAEPMRVVQAQGTLSFKGTMDRLDQWQWAIWSAPSGRQSRQRRDDLPQTIADDPVPMRPGRKEPRVCKDRQNKYTFMTKQRHLYGLDHKTTSLMRPNHALFQCHSTLTPFSFSILVLLTSAATDNGWLTPS